MLTYSAINTKYLPDYKTTGSAWWDLRSRETITIQPHETVKLPTWLKVAIPEWMVWIIKPRSSLVFNKNLLVVDWTIDSDYRWEISIVAHNLWDEWVVVEEWDRVAQLILLNYEKPECNVFLNYDAFEMVYQTERWTWWFWSTWNK